VFGYSSGTTWRILFSAFSVVDHGSGPPNVGLLEHSVTQLGGTYAMEDTDSMAIVSAKKRGTIPCKGRNHSVKDGTEVINALSWGQVDGLVKKFEALNPYDRNVIPGSVLQ
jgi:hypothetical protein